jgi:hypothetical protein
MQTESKKPARAGENARADPDTSSYEQRPGTTNGRRDQTRRNPKMPHERDESAPSQAQTTEHSRPPADAQISQAHDDVEHGLVDTDRRGIPDDLPRSDRTK